MNIFFSIIKKFLHSLYSQPLLYCSITYKINCLRNVSLRFSTFFYTLIPKNKGGNTMYPFRNIILQALFLFLIQLLAYYLVTTFILHIKWSFSCLISDVSFITMWSTYIIRNVSIPIIIKLWKKYHNKKELVTSNSFFVYRICFITICYH